MTPSENKLRRSRHNRVVAGVCGGLGEFFGISAFWFRLLFVILLIPGGVPASSPTSYCGLSSQKPDAINNVIWISYPEVVQVNSATNPPSNHCVIHLEFMDN